MIKLFRQCFPLVVLGVILAALAELAAADVLYFPQLSLVGAEGFSDDDVAGDRQFDLPRWTTEIGIRELFGELHPSDWEALIGRCAVANDAMDDSQPASSLKHDSLEGVSFFLGAPPWTRQDGSDEFSENGLITDPTQKQFRLEVRVGALGTATGLNDGPAGTRPRNPQQLNSGVTSNVGTITRSLVGRAPSVRDSGALGIVLAERYYLDWPWSTRPGRNMFVWIIGPPAIVFLAVVTMAVFYKAARGPSR